MHAMKRRGWIAALAIPLVVLLTGPTAHAVEGEEGSEPTTLGPGSSLVDRIQVAAEEGSEGPQEIAAEVDLPMEGVGSLNFDEEGRITVSVRFDGEPSDALLARVGEIGLVSKVISFANAATVQVAPDRLADLAGIDGVADVIPALSPRVGNGSGSTGSGSGSGSGASPAAATPEGDPCGPIPIDGDAPLNSAAARAAFGVDGTGVTVGIISDSFDHLKTPKSWEDDVASGALPGEGNPCGRTAPVEILRDEASGGIDEGRAMAQIVHGIAPGAKLIFADNGHTEIEMAEHILALQEAGATVIVDDIGWGSETQYQKGFLSWAIEQVRAKGVAYFTAAGNATASATTGPAAGLPINSWSTRAYRPMACPAWVQEDPENVGPWDANDDCLDWDPAEAVSTPYETLTIGAKDGTFDSQVFLGEAVAMTETAFELRYYEWDPQSEQATRLSTITKFSSMYPIGAGKVNVRAGTEVRAVFVRTDRDPQQTREPALTFITESGGSLVAQRGHMGDNVNDWVGEAVRGHAGDGSGTSVASLDWSDPTKVREYSSLGPSTLLFEPLPVTGPYTGNRLPAPVVVDTPHVAAVDGTQTTFFGRTQVEDGETVFRFFGTSAAAPHAAAVAALARSLNPSVSGDDISELVVSTARGADLGGPVNPYPSRFEYQHVVGAGIVDAMRLLEEVPVPPAAPAGLAAVGESDSSVSASWDAGGSDVTGYRITLLDPANGDAVAGSADLPAGTIAHTFPGLAPNHDYTVRLVALSAAGESAPASDRATTLATAPAELALDSATDTSLSVTWKELSAPSEYRVYIAAAGSAAPANARAAADPVKLPAGTTAYTFTGLDPETKYTITVAAINMELAPSEARVDGRTLAAKVPPTPGPDGSGGAGGAGGSGGVGGAKSPGLAKTGGDTMMPLAAGGLALLLLGGGLTAAALRSRGRRAAAELGADPEH